jgi:hypothetical protein
MCFSNSGGPALSFARSKYHRYTIQSLHQTSARRAVSEAGRGLGFGHSNAWRIVTLHSGAIEVREAPAAARQL